MSGVVKQKENFDLAQEIIPLDESFPVFMFSYNISKDPISFLHSHNVLELGICMKGSGIFIIEKTIHAYEAGDMIFIGPKVYHRAKSSRGMDDLWHFIYFDPATWGFPDYPETIGTVVGKQNEPVLHNLLMALYEEMRELRLNRKEIIKGLVFSISAWIQRLASVDVDAGFTHPNVHLPGLDNRILKAIDLMITAEGYQHSIPELAENSCLSESQFRNLFRSQVGMSPKNFQMRLVMKIAMNMLREDRLRIIDIAQECGFSSLSSFNRQFKMETGLAPQQWKNMHPR